MVKIESRRSGAGAVIEVSGEMGIQEAGQLASELRGACEGAGEVLIDLRGVTSFDLACLQILCAAHRTYGRMTGGIRLRAVLSPVVTETIADIGVEPQLCGAETSAACLWKKGGAA